MFSRTKLMSALGIAALALAACSSPSQAPASAPSPEVTSTSASPSPTPSSTSVSPTPSPTPSVQVMSETPAPEPTSASPSPEPTTAAPADQAVAAPGTNCGSVSHSSSGTQGDVYVSGGQVSCSEALAVVNAYLPKIVENIAYSRDAVAEGIMGGYRCFLNRGYAGAATQLSGQQALCQNDANGAYIEVRKPGERVLPGYVVDIQKHLIPNLSQNPQSMLSVEFSTPSQKIDCRGTLEAGGISCRVFLANGKLTIVGIGKSGPISTYDFFDGAVGPVTAPSVDVGTVITALGISCKPTDAQTLYCVNATHSVTLSPNGIVQD